MPRLPSGESGAEVIGFFHVSGITRGAPGFYLMMLLFTAVLATVIIVYSMAMVKEPR